MAPPCSRTILGVYSATPQSTANSHCQGIDPAFRRTMGFRRIDMHSRTGNEVFRTRISRDCRGEPDHGGKDRRGYRAALRGNGRPDPSPLQRRSVTPRPVPVRSAGRDRRSGGPVPGRTKRSGTGIPAHDTRGCLLDIVGGDSRTFCGIYKPRAVLNTSCGNMGSVKAS